MPVTQQVQPSRRQEWIVTPQSAPVSRAPASTHSTIDEWTTKDSAGGLVVAFLGRALSQDDSVRGLRSFGKKIIAALFGAGE